MLTQCRLHALSPNPHRNSNHPATGLLPTLPDKETEIQRGKQLGQGVTTFGFVIVEPTGMESGTVTGCLLVFFVSLDGFVL